MFTYEDAVRISKEQNDAYVYVSLKLWARKVRGAYGARNMYKVIKETEKAIKVVCVDDDDGEAFWAAKSTVIENEF